MSSDRRQAIQKKRLRATRKNRARRVASLKRWLATLKLGFAMDGLKKPMVDQLIRMQWPVPQISWSERFPSAPFAQGAKKAVDGAWEKLRYSPEGLDWQHPAVEYVTIFFPLMRFLDKIRAGSRFEQELDPLVNAAGWCMLDVVKLWSQTVAHDVIPYSRLDHTVVARDLQLTELTHDRTQITLFIDAVPVPARPVMLNGVQRKAYRVGNIGGPPDSLWISWGRDQIPTCSCSGVPVFVQAHALERLAERLRLPGRGCDESEPDWTGLTHYTLA